tara:strand:+ start:65 stop:310 length:246 start_codon:yes stop_codon:yes gene_type:complete
MWETVKTIRIDRDITTEEAEDYGYEVASDLGIQDAHVEVKVEGEEYIVELQEFFDVEEEEGYTAEEEDQYNIDQYRYSRRA